ncbi:Flp pilus assembly protein CpaB [Roseibacterium sp. SDUM158017]|uniref:Flp pilus assembly protein CpaB n=1 Tax=Roseicyclus salinarum TaxID=3036773 RepID=UPI00241548D6|nr:Flp pilus assembly protein CpaB [Roseibacterium sp. SDUM158017]MDG4647350.1 Flp pilus assembly protein CpaB [Roseibacterium sp. SDUM158017]
MKLTSLLLAAIGTSFAGGSAFIAYDFMETRTTRVAAEQRPELVEIMIAAQDIAFGESIEAHMLTARPWPREALPDGAFTRPDALLAGSGQDPRRARSPIVRGQPVLVSQVSGFGEKVTIVETLSENGRAVAITVNAETAAGGFVTPGDYVDVILTQGSGDSLRAVTILQNIRVIAVDQDANERSDAPQVSRTVTVDVTPQQGQALALAQRAGRLSLMLRDYSTEDDLPMRTLRLSDVLLEESPVPEEVVRSRTITVRRGTEVETVAARGNGS